MRILTAAASLTILIHAQPLLAQADVTAPKDDESAKAENETIVVTAQFRDQRPSEVPFSLTTFGATLLEDLNIRGFEDLARYTPGLAVQNQSPNNPAFSIRGITADNGASFFEPRVSIYQDGVSISKSRGAYVELFDLERVEIAKGPQSSLYGRGALIGAVNLVQGKPKLGQTYARLQGEAGSFDYRLAEAMINASLLPNAALRIAARLRSRDGYVDNLVPGGSDFDSIETGAVRATFRVIPSQGTTIDLIGNFQKDETAGTSFQSLIYRPTDPVTGELLVLGANGRGVALGPGAGFEGGADLGLNRRVWGLTAITKVQLAQQLTAQLTSGYRTFDLTEVLDVDGTSLPIITGAEHAENRQFSQDLRLNWRHSPILTTSLGFSYFHENGSQRVPVQFDERMVLAQLAGALNGGGLLPGRPISDPAPQSVFDNAAFNRNLLLGIANRTGVPLSSQLASAIAANLKPDHRESETNSAKTSSVDIFGDLSWLAAPTLEIGLGLRWTYDRKNTQIRSQVLNGRSILGGFIGALSLPEPLRSQLLTALGAPGAAVIPPSVSYPVPLFGLTFQPTSNNGDMASETLKGGGLSWRAFVRYEPSRDTSIYGIYARGRRPQVLSAMGPSRPYDEPRFNLVSAETVDSFEVGAKRAFGGGFYGDFAAYHYRYENFQTMEQLGTTFVLTNAGKARSFGFEAQARYNPSAPLRIFANYAFNRTRFKSGHLNGNRPRLSPDHTFATGLTLQGGFLGGQVDFTPSVTYQSKVYFDDNNDLPGLQLPPRTLLPDLIRDEFQEGFALVSARLGYAPGAKLRIELYADNILDRKYFKDAGNTGDGLGLPTFVLGQPRTFGAQLTANF